MPPLPVLLIHRKPGATVRFIDQVIGEGDPELEFRFGRARLGEPDLGVVYLPRFTSLLGPEAPSGPRLALRMLSIGRDLRRRRIALVRTITEADAPADRWERLAQRVLNHFTTSFVALDDTARVRRGASLTVIAHAHYRDRFCGYPRSEQIADRALWLGPAGLTVGTSGVLNAPLPSGATVRFVGLADESTRARLTTAADHRPETISTRLERLSDGALVAEITAAAVVVLPSVEEPEELNAVHLALSLDRPVIVPATPAMRALQQSVGTAWVHLSTGEPSAETLDRALASHRLGERPQVPGGDLIATSARYAEVFRDAAASVR